MLPNMAVFADNGITGATHGVALRKVLLKEDGFSSSNFITLSGSSIFSILIGLITLVVKYRWPPSIISARFLSSASVIANSNTELLYIDTLHLSFLCKKIGNKKCIVNFHNYDPEYLLELSRLEKSILRSLLFKYESFISKIILRRLEKIDRLEMWALTSKDFDSARLLLNYSKKIKLIPHQLPRFGAYKSSDALNNSRPCLDLIFIGAGGHGPNKEALDFIISILDCNTRFVAHIVGPSWKIHSHPRLKFHGFVKKLDAFLADNYLFICPIFSGSGINMKVFTAIEFGLPGILSQFTREPFNVYGKDFPDEEYVVVNGKDPKSWADLIIKRSELLSREK